LQILNRFADLSADAQPKPGADTEVERHADGSRVVQRAQRGRRELVGMCKKVLVSVASVALRTFIG